MTISLRCACGAKLKAKDSLAGKKVACPKCKQPLLVAPSATPEAAPPDPLTTGGDVGDPLRLSAGGDLGDAVDPFAGDNLGDGSGLFANDATAATGDALDLGDLSAFDLGAGGASPLGAPMQLPAYTAKPASSPAKKSTPAKDNKMLLIAAAGGGVALLLLLVGVLVAWMMLSGGKEVAENSPPTNSPSSAPADQAAATDPQAQMASNMSQQTQPSSAAPNGAYADAMSQSYPAMTGADAQSAAAVANEASGAAPVGSPVAPIAPTTSAPVSRQAKIRDDNGIQMKLCLCPAGKFYYGGEGSEADITNEFWIGQTEVTQGQWKLVMQTTPWTGQPNAVSGDNYAANFVSWHDATVFCARMTQVEREQGRLEDDLEYRLPTEAERTYAAHAPSISASTGKRHKLTEKAWFKDNSGNRMHEVGELAANSFGVHDLTGNLAEWTLDRFATPDQAKQPVYGGQNPFQWHDVAEGATEQWHMLRGGYYGSSSGLLDVRGTGTDANLATVAIGFRVVLARPPKPTLAPPAKPTAPGPSPHEPWFVLSNLDASPTGADYEVTVDWNLAQGSPEPGKKYLIYVNMKVVNGFVGSIETIEVDLNGQQGTAVGKVAARDANGPRVVTHVVMGDEQGEGFRMLTSGELKVGQRSSAAKPPAP